jgi:hypothetical protein
VKERKEITTGQTDPESSLGEALRRDQPIQCENRQTSEINSIQLLFTPVEAVYPPVGICYPANPGMMYSSRNVVLIEINKNFG